MMFPDPETKIHAEEIIDIILMTRGDLPTNVHSMCKDNSFTRWLITQEMEKLGQWVAAIAQDLAISLPGDTNGGRKGAVAVSNVPAPAPNPRIERVCVEGALSV